LVAPVLLLPQLNHPYVCNMIEVVRDREHIYIIMVSASCMGAAGI
jgi:hypothetical protein